MKQLTLTMMGFDGHGQVNIKAPEMSRQQAIDAAAAVMMWATRDSGARPHEIVAAMHDRVRFAFAMGGVNSSTPDEIECTIMPLAKKV